MELNIWELGNRINVRLDGEFYSTLKSMIKSRYCALEKFYVEFKKQYTISFSVLKDRLKPNYPYFVNLEIYIAMCRIFEISLEAMQMHIVAYKTRGGGNYIENPILPIKITPIFDMLVAHHIGDGCLMNSSANRKDYFLYRQYDKQYRDLYIKKIESIFGKIHYKNDYINKTKTTQVYAPIVASELMYTHYRLSRRSFISETARIPEQIFEKDSDFKLAFLIGMIIDEGHIDSCLIVIRLKNQDLIKDLSKLCADLDYKKSVKIENNGYACLYILSSSLDKFYKDYLVLLSIYPEADLGHKGLKLKEFIDRINKPKIYRPGNKEIILNILSQKDLTVNELATLMNMTRQGVRYLINQLVKEGKIKVKSIVKFANWKYGVK